MCVRVCVCACVRACVRVFVTSQQPSTHVANVVGPGPGAVEDLLGLHGAHVRLHAADALQAEVVHLGEDVRDVSAFVELDREYGEGIRRVE